MSPRRAPTGAVRAPERDENGLRPPDGTTGAPLANSDGLWRLWFPAKQSLAPRKLTASGKPKRKPPELPPNVNERRAMHWQQERALVGYWRLLAKTLARYADIPRLQRVRISAVVHRRALGVADEDGDASRLKPLVDGLRDAKVIPNDTRGYVTYGSCAEKRAGVDGPGIELIVERLEVLR